MEFKPFDVSAKELIWDDPAACLERFGVGPPGPVDVIDSDITALTAVADKVLRVGGPGPYLVNLEPQSSHDSDLVVNLWFRQAALYRRHRLPVLTVLILLRREANARAITGKFEIQMPDGWQTNLYSYRVVRFGTPDERIRNAIEIIRDLEHLEGLSQRLFDSNIKDWAELLGTP